MVVLIAFTIPAHAQTAQLFTPTSGWLVGPATVAPDSAGLPCVMMDQFDNGYTFRFSGGGKKLLALAIDFRQAVFKPGAHYPLTLTVTPGFLRKFDANAYTDAILIVGAADVQGAQEFYQAINTGQKLTISFGAKTLDFSLIGARDGLQRLEACYGAAGTATAGAPDQPASTGEPSVPDIAARPGSPAPAETGVDTLLDQAAHNVAATQNAPSTVSAPGHWQAKARSSLKDVLTRWSQQGNAGLTWSAPGDYQVLESLSSDGTYEQAVQELLSEYNAAAKRPVGTLSLDPQTGRKTLDVRQVGQ